jgi:sugar phosphate isomerase/epimerase
MDPFGVALFTVRDQLRNEPGSTLQAIAAMGFRHVESRYDELESLGSPLRDAGLRVSSVHLDLGTLIGDPKYASPFIRTTPAPGDFERALDVSVELGVDNVGLAYISPEHRGSLDEYRRFAGVLNAAGEKAGKAGATFTYHNHSFEFKPQEGSTPFAALEAELDPDYVSLELDVFWLHMAGVDPLPFLKDRADRISHLHLKDVNGGVPPSFDERAVGRDMPHAFEHLGNGVLDIAGVVGFAREQHIRFCYVEQDETPGDPLESLRASYDYLVSLSD